MWKRCRILILIGHTPITALNAGSHRLTYSQAYESGEPQLIRDLPDIEGWINDTTFVEAVETDEEGKALLKLLGMPFRN